MQRLLITFGRSEATKYIAHLDMMRFWERAFRRAHLNLAVSSGFHPHPHFALAAPLPVGVTSEGELMEAFLETSVTPEQCYRALTAQLVPGISVMGVEEIGLQLPSLQAQMRFAEYRVTLESDRIQSDVESSVAELLALTTLPWEHTRDGEVRHYDLRSQVSTLSVASCGNGRCVIEMRLQCDSNASGRPEQVARALGFPDHPLNIHRVKLVLSKTPFEQLKPKNSEPAVPSKK